MRKTRRSIPIALVGAFLLAACAGNGVTGLSPADSPDVWRTGSAPGPVDMPTVIGAYGPAAISLDRTPGGLGRRTIAEYLHIFAAGAPVASSHDDRHAPGLATWRNPPTVRIARGTAAHLRDAATRAVSMINAWLPWDQRIRIGDDATPRIAIDTVPDGQILVDFEPPESWNLPANTSVDPRSIGIAETVTAVEWNELLSRQERRHMIKGHAWIDPRAGPRLLEVTLHELLHTLGLQGHVSAHRFPTSIMTPFTGMSRILPAIDGEGLLAAYTRYAPGVAGEDVTYQTLGAWTTETMHLRGDLTMAGTSVAFGVGFRNGLGRPWAEGVEPTVSLADNAALTGPVEWNGVLLGFTWSGRTAAGKASVVVDLPAMTGRAGFTDIESWAGNPGREGSGQDERSFTYGIVVNGNSFRNAGGDDGTLNGLFVGSGHEGAVGTLENGTLTAAFGTARD